VRKIRTNKRGERRKDEGSDMFLVGERLSDI
jgi:hypothetical protein